MRDLPYIARLRYGLRTTQEQRRGNGGGQEGGGNRKGCHAGTATFVPKSNADTSCDCMGLPSISSWIKPLRIDRWSPDAAVTNPDDRAAARAATRRLGGRRRSIATASP